MGRPFKHPIDGDPRDSRHVAYLANAEDLANLAALLRLFPGLTQSDVLRAAVRHAIRTMTVAHPRTTARPVVRGTTP